MALRSRALELLGVGLLAALTGAAVAHGSALPLLELCGAAAAAVLLVAITRRLAFGVPALALLIAAFPVARIVFQGVPIYLTDVLALLLLVAAARLGGRLSGYAWLVVVYLATWTLAWVHEVLSLHLFLAPTYGLVRNLLAVAVFFPAYLLARKHGGDARWLPALAAGAAITAVLAVLQDVAPGPTNRVLVALAPNFTTTGLKTYPHRAFALFSAATTLAGFLAIAILLFVSASGAVERRQRKYLVAATVLCALGMVATYSRQWVPALAAGLVALAWLRLGLSRRLVAGAAAALGVSWLLLATGVLSSSYLNARFSTLGTADVNVQSRLSREHAFVAMVRTEPTTFAVGKGFAGQDLVDRGYVDASAADSLRAGINDNVFLLEVFNHGIVAAVLYLGLFVTAVLRILGAARRRVADAALLAGIGSALVAAFVLQLSDNYFSESVFMKLFLWLLIGTGIGLVERGRASA